jgi:hypothetical protein
VEEHIGFIDHQGKQILVADFSNCSAKRVEEIARAIPAHVTVQPLKSVLLLTDFTGASFDEESLRTMKETAVFNKLYIKKSAWVGAASLPATFDEEIKGFSRREFPTFRTRQEALAWLAKD